MRINWEMLARLIAMLSKIAMEWYRLVNTDEDTNADARKALKVAVIMADPARPENDVAEVDVDEAMSA